MDFNIIHICNCGYKCTHSVKFLGFFEEVIHIKTASQTQVVRDRRLPIRSSQVTHEELQIDHSLYMQLPLVEFSSIIARIRSFSF